MENGGKATKELACAGRMCAKGADDLRRIKGLLFSLCLLFLIIHPTFAFSPLYLLYTEYQSLVSLSFIGFVLLSSYLFVSRKVFSSLTFLDRIRCAPPIVEKIE